jgi:hypothetical protein
MIFTQPPLLTLQPFGASAGVRGVRLQVGPSNEDTDVFDEAKAKLLLQQVKDYLTPGQYEELLVGQLHLLWEGTPGIDVADTAIRADLLQFVEVFSKESLDYQVKTLKRDSHGLRPPFMELHTLGLNYTGNDEFYENFNYVVVLPALSWTGKPKEERYAPFALVEISKHKFSTFVFRVKSADDWAEINQDFLVSKYVDVQKQRIFVVPATAVGQDNYVEAARQIALEQGVRFGVDLGEV